MENEELTNGPNPESNEAVDFNYIDQELLLNNPEEARTVPDYWPLFDEKTEINDSINFDYVGYAKKISPNTFKIVDSGETGEKEENIFYDKSGLLEKALQEENQTIIRKIITH